jgi:hypothetical protein
VRETSATDLLKLRVIRLRARTIIRLGDHRGRLLIVGLLGRLGGATVVIEPEGADERARFLSDLSGDLSLIGDHDSAIGLARSLVDVAPGGVRHAYRLGDLAAWHLQRAVARRPGDTPDAAIADLAEAEGIAELALEQWQRVPSTTFARLGAREARAVRVSAIVERAAYEPVDLLGARHELHELLRQSLPLPRDESYLQVLYRIGRLGVTHLREAEKESGDSRRRRLDRARAYLAHAWRSSANASVRPWLALDLLDALSASDDEDAVKAFGREALERLEPQCGPTDPAVERIRAYLS